MVLIAELVGKKLLNGTYSTELDSNELKNKTIGLYFSAYWCRHCRSFTSKLVQAYKTALSNNSNLLFDIVFVSSDTDEESFNEYYKQMPWKAIPYENRQQAENLNERYDIEDIPSLIILKPNCEILTSEANEELISANAIEKWTEGKTVFWTPESQDNSEQVWLNIYCQSCYMKPLVGERFGCPNRECSYDLCAECYSKITKENEHNHELINFLSPKNKYSIEQLFYHSDLISNHNECVTLKSYEGKYVGLYFSALWCPANENITSDLMQVYEKVIETNLPFDIIFISADSTQTMFNKHCQQMPWKALPFDNYVTRLRLKTYFSVSILPALIILKPTGELLTKSGQRDIKIKKIEAIQTWCKGEKVEHSPDDFVWSSVTCDGCGMMPLIGKRFYCETCSNYDLCTACKEKGHEHELILIAQLDEID